MTSVSLNISLELVHLTTTPLIHIFFYRIEIDKQGQCSGTFTLGFNHLRDLPPTGEYSPIPMPLFLHRFPMKSQCLIAIQGLEIGN